jgi:uncharacterized membrane protein
MEDKETGRLEAFSDGVFAVAITLLVLNINLPIDPGKLLDDGALWGMLGLKWPLLVAYITSFATIGIMWLNHHRLFQHIRRANTVLMLLNLLLLLVIVFIPVPTALLADYLAHPEYHTAALIYSGTNIAMACSFYTLWSYASYKGRLLGKNVDPRSVMAISWQYAFGPISYIVVFAVAWFNVPTCIFLSFVMALFFAIPGRTLRTIPDRRKAAGEIEVVDVEEQEA